MIEVPETDGFNAPKKHWTRDVGDVFKSKAVIDLCSGRLGEGHKMAKKWLRSKN
jgi:hypothetical protein